MIRREIERKFGGEVEIEVAGEGEGGKAEKVKKKAKVNAVLIDYLLYDIAKEKENEKEDGEEEGVSGDSEKGMRLPHHRTRGIWY